MTSKPSPKFCDHCGLEISSEEKYKVQFTKAGTKQGEFIKCTTKADMCHPCFLIVCKNGLKPIWVTMQKLPNGSWAEKPEVIQKPQEVLATT